MSLITVDLDPPEKLNHRWASLAAVMAAREWGEFAYARGPLRYYHDGSGNWARMVLLPQQRAVLFGNDHEFSNTYWAEAAEYFGEDETDLLAGAPSWWGDAVAEHREGGDVDWIGFIYGWQDGHWQRAAYDLDDGFTSVGVPVSDVYVIEGVESTAVYDEPLHQPNFAALKAMVHAGPEVTEEQLRAVIAPGQDVAAAAAAAAAFRLPDWPSPG